LNLYSPITKPFFEGSCKSFPRNNLSYKKGEAKIIFGLNYFILLKLSAKAAKAVKDKKGKTILCPPGKKRTRVEGEKRDGLTFFTAFFNS
jgi:hypothetical protein